VPLFNGFISKSMVIASAALKHEPIIEMLLVLASVGTFLCIGVKIPHIVFFTGKTEAEAYEPTWNMLAGMGFMSFLCVLIGVYPKVLYDILPYPVHFHPYSMDHVIGTMGILLGTILGYKILYKKLVLESVIVLDIDWFYRKFGNIFLRFCCDILDRSGRKVQENLSGMVASLIRLSKDPLYDSEVAFYRMRTKMMGVFEHSPDAFSERDNRGKISGLSRILGRGRGYDENFYRRSVGLGVFLVVLIFFLLSWFFMETG